MVPCRLSSLFGGIEDREKIKENQLYVYAADSNDPTQLSTTIVGSILRERDDRPSDDLSNPKRLLCGELVIVFVTSRISRDCKSESGPEKYTVPRACYLCTFGHESEEPDITMRKNRKEPKGTFRFSVSFVSARARARVRFVVFDGAPILRNFRR